MLPANNEDDMSFEECTDDLNRACAEIANCTGDTAIALSQLADDGAVFEVKAGYAKEMVTALIRLNGVTVGAVANGIIPLAYAGIMSSGVAYTLQIVGQKDMDPTIASLILSMESVVSMLAGWAILGQALNGRELLGCALVFGAVILVQLPDKKSSQE